MRVLPLICVISILVFKVDSFYIGRFYKEIYRWWNKNNDIFTNWGWDKEESINTILSRANPEGMCVLQCI